MGKRFASSVVRKQIPFASSLNNGYFIILEHPEWVEEDGACPKCTEYYESLTDNLDII